MKKIKVSCESETGKLESVIIGFGDNFHINPSFIEVTNAKQEKNIGTDQDARIEGMITDLHELKMVLSERGIEVYTPKACSEEAKCPCQVYPRDIGFVIGETFFLASMASKSRRREFEGIQYLINSMDQKNIIKIPDDVVLEGGDVMVDKGNVFVGLGQRSNPEGYHYLKEKLNGTNFNVIPVRTKSLKDGEDCLHLDCTFMPVGDKYALIYHEGIEMIPHEMIQDYTFIEINREEQERMGTNVLSISPTEVISRDIERRVNEEMRKAGINVIEVSFNEPAKLGGSLRCCTLPLVRIQ